MFFLNIELPPPLLDFPLHKQKKHVFFMSPLAVFEKIMQFSKFLILQAKMRIDKNARLQAFVQKTWENLIYNYFTDVLRLVDQVSA